MWKFDALDERIQIKLEKACVKLFKSLSVKGKLLFSSDKNIVKRLEVGNFVSNFTRAFQNRLDTIENWKLSAKVK